MVMLGCLNICCALRHSKRIQPRGGWRKIWRAISGDHAEKAATYSARVARTVSFPRCGSFSRGRGANAYQLAPVASDSLCTRTKVVSLVYGRENVKSAPKPRAIAKHKHIIEVVDGARSTGSQSLLFPIVRRFKFRRLIIWMCHLCCETVRK